MITHSCQNVSIRLQIRCFYTYHNKKNHYFNYTQHNTLHINKYLIIV